MSHPAADIERKTDRLDRLLAAEDLSELWIADPDNVAWLLGADLTVVKGATVGVGAVHYDGSGLAVLTDTIEAERLAAEELPSAVSVEAIEWYGPWFPDVIAERAGPSTGADIDIDGLTRVDIDPKRQPLTEHDIETYRSLSADAVAAVESVASDIDPALTEQAVAGRVTGALAESGIDTPVVLVGSAERAPNYRHFTPTETSLGAYATISVTARRKGLYSSFSRTVAFDPPSWLAERHRNAARIEVTALEATQDVAATNGTAGEVFAQIQDAYESVGVPGEWERHHQGGAAGYAGREWIATPDATDPVTTPMAYAWNPTITGAKSEGTVLIRSESLEPLTGSEEWPTITVQSTSGELSCPRPGIKHLSAH